MTPWMARSVDGQQAPVRTALTIAGSDSSGGAGLQADLKTFQELGVFGMSVVTAVTAQNSLGVHRVYPLPPEAVSAQLEAVLDDIGADVVKTGMLHSAEIIHAAADKLSSRKGLKLVVDPVMAPKKGLLLLQEEASEALCSRLLPLATVMTPNIPEACVLLGLEEEEIRTVQDMEDAARELLRFGSRYVLLKGGHLQQSEEATDVLAAADHPLEPIRFPAPKASGRHTHGTGCTLASALAAFLACDMPVEEAAWQAKRFTLAAIRESGPLGEGTGCLWHAAWRGGPNGEAQPRGSSRVLL